MFVIVVTWTEPEEGTAAYGPFETREAADAAIPVVMPDFQNSDVLPDDVVFDVRQLCKPVRS